MVDLHIHSNYSDGTKTIEEIVKMASELHLSQIAITDHNTLKGAIAAKKISSIDLVIGTELSVGYLNEELHLLGYFPNGSDYSNVNYVITLGEINKKLAITEMVERLNAQGYDISLTELNEFGKGVINRVHICNVLMKKGYISSVSEGFAKVVGDHCPAYVQREYVPIIDAINAIHKDGGIAVLAHPYNYNGVKDIPRLLNDVKDYVDGIECFHYSATVEQSNYLVDYALKHHLRITGGSDFHGDNKPNITLNMMKVDDSYRI